MSIERKKSSPAVFVRQVRQELQKVTWPQRRDTFISSAIVILLIILFSLAGVPPLGGFFAKFYVFVAVLEKEMYALAIIGLLTTVMSAFYYLKIIKTIYFDDSLITFESPKNMTAQISVFVSCTILITFFLYPSVLNNLVNNLFVG